MHILHPSKRETNASLFVMAVGRFLICTFVIISCFGSCYHQGLVEAVTSHPYRYFDQLRFANTSSFRGRVGNVDVIIDNSENGEGTEYGLCHLVGLFGFSTRSGGKAQSRGKAPYLELAASLLAAHHFNTGNGSIVSDVEGINERCNVRFTTEFTDTELDVFTGLKTLTEVITREPDENGITEILPCTILGAYRSAVTKPTSILSSVHDMAQMSFYSPSSDLEDAAQFPYFARLTSSDDTLTDVAVRYLTKINNVGHCAILFVNDAQGKTLETNMKKYAAINQLQIESFSFPLDPSPNDVSSTLQKVKDTGFRYIFTLMLPDNYVAFMTEAVNLGIAGPEYSWLFFGAFHRAYFQNWSYPRGSPLDVFLRGVGIIGERGGHPGFYRHDAFTEAWRSMTDSDVDYFNSKMPPSGGGNGVDYFQAPSGFFQNEGPGIIAPFAYDTVIAMGLAACNATAAADNSDGTTYFGGREHARAIVSQPVFEGTSGLTKINDTTRSRVPTSSFFVVFNVVPNEDEGSRNVTFRVPESIMLKPNADATHWEKVEKMPFIYADGSTTPPPDLPPLAFNYNYIGNLVILGGILCGIVLALSIGFAVWTYVNRDVRVVKASQPSFLIMICVGTFILGSALIPHSIDDEHFSQGACDIACMAVPWLGSIGFVTAFSALFSKTWRINKIFHNPVRFQRIKVTEKDVIIPFVILMAASVTVLICWTVLAPLTFVREERAGRDQYGRVISSFGICKSQTDRRGGAIPYIVLIGVIDFCVIVLANAQAYQARNVKTEFSESRYIAIVMASLLQAWATGVPLLFLVWVLPQANYLVRAFLLFVTCMAILLFIFVPKIMFTKKYKMERAQREAEKKAKRDARAAEGATGATALSSTGDSLADDGSSGLKIAVVHSTVVNDTGRLVVRSDNEVE